MSIQNKFSIKWSSIIICYVKRCFYRICIILLLTGNALMFGCNHDDVKSQNMRKNIPNQEIDILLSCQTTKDLKVFYATKSLGGKVQVQIKKRLIFVQTFPYSGVRASHLYVYVQATNELRFECFFRVQTQNSVELQLKDNDSVEIKVGDERVSVLNQPSDK